jgi:sec-independent protein translocase protein TatB
MEILGIGPQELIFVIIIALIVLGPKDMQKAGRTIGQWLNRVVKSEGWKAFQQTSKELRNLPNTLMREANLDLTETEKEIRESMKMPPLPGMPLRSNENPVVAPKVNLPKPSEAENTIQPPPADLKAQAAVAREESSEAGGGNDTDIKDEKVSKPNQNE